MSKEKTRIEVEKGWRKRERGVCKETKRIIDNIVWKLFYLHLNAFISTQRAKNTNRYKIITVTYYDNDGVR